MPDPRPFVMTIRTTLVPKWLHVLGYRYLHARARRQRLTFRLLGLSLGGAVLKNLEVSSSLYFLFFGKILFDREKDRWRTGEWVHML